MRDLHGFKKIEEKFDSNRFESTNVPARNLSAIKQTKGCPLMADQDINSPESEGIHINFQIL